MVESQERNKRKTRHYRNYKRVRTDRRIRKRVTEKFYDELKRTYEGAPKYDAKIVLRNFNANTRKEGRTIEVTCRYTLQESTS
jgi:hypothetical protein